LTASASATTGLMLSGFCARPRYVAGAMGLARAAGVRAEPVLAQFT
jgi:hypothetical protein